MTAPVIPSLAPVIERARAVLSAHGGDARPPAAARRPALPTDFSRPIIAGCVIIGLFFVGLGGWAALAPLSSASVAPGTVVVDTKRKLIQHLEGGIVREILVRESDRVTPGQVLLRLDGTQAKSRVQLIAGRYLAALARAARLQAEAGNQPRIAFPDVLSEHATEPEVARVIATETDLFRTGLDQLTSQTRILEQRDALLAEEIKGHEGQIASGVRQLALIKDEMKVVEQLLADGLALRPRLLLLQRQAAEIEGKRSESQAQIARARQTMGDTRLRIADLVTTRVNEAQKMLGDTKKEIGDLAEQMRAARDVSERLEVRAPEEGIVVNLAVNTPGGVIAPGSVLMEIVPSLDRLVIEARVDVADIEKVDAGRPAEIRLLAYNRRTTPTVGGQVVWISADRIDSDKTRPAYFAARVAVNEGELAALDDVRLYPGMPVEVMIQSGKHSMLDYLMTPINRTFARAFREK